ncbi:MAG: hypothetical protein Q9M28_04505 [Mariprofundaceae bacterium]|nr:hypothetical protein [Mariprofundaceae bacterium]
MIVVTNNKGLPIFKIYIILYVILAIIALVVFPELRTDLFSALTDLELKDLEGVFGLLMTTLFLTFLVIFIPLLIINGIKTSNKNEREILADGYTPVSGSLFFHSNKNSYVISTGSTKCTFTGEDIASWTHTWTSRGTSTYNHQIEFNTNDYNIPLLKASVNGKSDVRRLEILESACK